MGRHRLWTASRPVDAGLTGERRRASRRTVVRVDTMVARATAAGVSRVALPAERAAEALDTLTDLVAAGGVLVLSGAGISTESGIPDYRGPSSTARRASPMTYQTFTGDPAARRRYWARSHLGWQLVGRAAPNRGHRAVAALQDAGLLSGRDHPERGRPAPGRRRPRRDRPARPAGPGALPRLRPAVRAGRAARAAGRGQRELARDRGRDQPGRRRRSARQRAGRLPARWTATTAPACSSRTWCSSARPCRRTGSRAATSCWPGPAACSCSARR